MELSGEGGDSGFSGGRGDPGRQPSACRRDAKNGVGAISNELAAGGVASESEQRDPPAEDEECEKEDEGNG